MKTLLDQEYVSLGDASKRMSVDLSTLANYIKDNVLQLVIRLPNPEDKFIADVREISSFNERLSRSSDVYQIVTRWEPVSVGLFRAPKYLVVDFNSPIIHFTDEPPHLYKSMCFLTAGGNRLVLLNSDGRPEFVYLGEKDRSGLFSDGFISVAAIRNFLSVRAKPEGTLEVSNHNQVSQPIEDGSTPPNLDSVGEPEKFRKFCYELDRNPDKWIRGLDEKSRDTNSAFYLTAACRAYVEYYKSHPTTPKLVIDFIKRYTKETEPDGQVWDWYVHADKKVTVEPRGGGKPRSEDDISRSIEGILKKMVKPS